MIEIRKLKTPADIATEAARLAANDLKKTLESHELATFVLAGGKLPPIASTILAEKHADDFDWKRVLFLIGDERCVPLDSPDSNWLGAQPMFESHPEIPASHLLRPQSNLSAEFAADAYEKRLSTLPHNKLGMPIFNHMWFGIGEDGHTLSIFPGHPSLAMAQTTDKLIIPVHDSPKPPPDRISFSLKTLQGVETAVVFVSGASKAPIVAQIMSGDRSLPIVIASKVIEGAGGRVIWLIDKKAASQVEAGQIL